MQGGGYVQMFVVGSDDVGEYVDFVILFDFVQEVGVYFQVVECVLGGLLIGFVDFQQIYQFVDGVVEDQVVVCIVHMVVVVDLFGLDLWLVDGQC